MAEKNSLIPGAKVIPFATRGVDTTFKGPGGPGGGGGDMERIEALEKGVDRLDRRLEGFERRMDDGFREMRAMGSDMSRLMAGQAEMSAALTIITKDLSDKPGKAYVWRSMLAAAVMAGGATWFLWSNLATIIAALQAIKSAAP